jgi:hypothetical protein
MLSFDRDHAAAVQDRTLASSSGAYAELTEDKGGESLKVYSRDRRLVFEYNPLSGRTTVFVPSGDLEFVTQGDISFTSARSISLRGQSVELTSRSSIRLSVTDMLGWIRSGLMLHCQRAKLTGPEVAIAARRGEFQVEEVNWTARRILGRVEHVRLVAGKLERFANLVIEKTRDVYTTVDGLVQLKAGRLRTLLDGTYHFKAKRAYMKAQEDFKINADKIHLG